MNNIISDSETKMKKSVVALKADLTKLRTGRASTSLLDHLRISYYGNDVPLNQVANVNVENSRTLSVTPWEKNMIADIEKAIMTSDLGLNPATAGTTIRIPLPPLTEERRKSLTKVVREEAEKARVAVRNIRRDANNQIKELEKNKTVSEDEERRLQTQMQKITDQSIVEIDKICAEKEKELMEV